MQVITMADHTLSPAAQAVLDAVAPHPAYGPAIAAALRAAADQVAPAGWLPHERVRHELLSIATELETSA
jgi:hypothetical protein